MSDQDAKPKADGAESLSTAGLGLLVKALLTYEQADVDGVRVRVSRQACDDAAALLYRQRDEIARLKKVVTVCWGALAELSPCMYGECQQPQTEALDLALRMAGSVVRPNA
jgi:hypothetical protein